MSLSQSDSPIDGVTAVYGVDERSPMVRLRLWLETSEGVFFGIGRALLLAKIEEYGSLKKAAGDLGMSYRAAWGKIKKTEKILGVQLIIQSGSKREGYQLTDFGALLKDRYLFWFNAVEEEAVKKARELFPWPVKSYED